MSVGPPHGGVDLKHAIANPNNLLMMSPPHGGWIETRSLPPTA